MSAACSVALKPSSTLAAVLSVAHLLALAAAALSLTGVALALTATGVILSGVWTVGDALLKWPGSVQRLELDEDGGGRWVDRAGRAYCVNETRATWISANLVVLGMHMPRKPTRWLVLLPDSGESEPLRSLRVWLKWHPSKKRSTFR